ncbi:MAG: phosphate signaling complex protein PhoU [Spongiibacter sp.]|uniref:Phosphate-specific transport system accessory protein PhoU n=1 Tax=Spongiibacter thalassae TaxID=2721624 RepID=A0ABX1GFM4_9GAMM|nr:phosphate signaling complex protein PhoU [Spongiibacter thalassae]MDX1505414.1 phosphate signaling complex protein PhoU [Spongiibacter sp.]NKI17946.1 phosphate signaling complex protein PhoU [Spongiibacter thalassae]
MKDKDLHAHHISQQFNSELDDIKTRMLEMGGLVEKQVADSINAFMSLDSGIAEEVKRGDQLVNALESAIDEECTIILARRQPTASDLRMVLSISKALSDLERMGDEATKVADAAMKLGELGGLPRSVLEIRHIGDHVLTMVRNALDAFARFDSEMALKVAEEDSAVDMEYGTAMRSLVTYMMEDPRSISSVLQVLWALRSLERVGDHARNIAEHVIYLVKGADVRHADIEEMAATVQELPDR